MRIVIPGQPKSQKRHRTGRNGRRYDPSKSDKQRLKKELLKIKPTDLLSGPLKIEINVFVQTPKSWSGAKKDRHEGEYRAKRPDADNYVKLILDAMNDYIFEDDGQVCDLTIRKFYSMQPCTELTIKKI